jgi:hypothetical protein
VANHGKQPMARNALIVAEWRSRSCCSSRGPPRAELSAPAGGAARIRCGKHVVLSPRAASRGLPVVR